PPCVTQAHVISNTNMSEIGDSGCACGSCVILNTPNATTVSCRCVGPCWLRYRFMRKAIVTVVMTMLLGWCAAPSLAADAYREQMRGLDEQVQEVKSDVLSIAAELNQLEEKLLYPSNTHLAVFVSLAGGESLRLDSVRIQIDGQPAAAYIYSFKELEALK